MGVLLLVILAALTIQADGRETFRSSFRATVSLTWQGSTVELSYFSIEVTQSIALRSTTSVCDSFDLNAVGPSYSRSSDPGTTGSRLLLRAAASPGFKLDSPFSTASGPANDPSSTDCPLDGPDANAYIEFEGGDDWKPWDESQGGAAPFPTVFQSETPNESDPSFVTSECSVTMLAFAKEAFEGRFDCGPDGPTGTFSGESFEVLESGVFSPPRAPETEQAPRAEVFSDSADEVAQRPVFTRALKSPEEVNWSPTVVGTNILLALLLVILMPFPAALFNSTLSANYQAVRRWFRLKPKPPGAPSMNTPRRSLAFGALLVVTALLNSALDPTLGIDRRSLTLFLGLLTAVAAVNLVGSIPDRLYMRFKYKDRPFVQLYPLALLIAVASVGVSRLIDYRPGYLYGLIAGIGLSKSLSDRQSGWATLRTTSWMFLVSGIAWLAWIPVKAAVESNPDQPGLLVLDTTLAALFAAGIAGNMFGLLPLKFLEGEKLFRWSRIAWGLLFGLGVFSFLQTLIDHTGDGVPKSSIIAATALFVGFGTLSILFWGYFRIKTNGAKEVVD